MTPRRPLILQVAIGLSAFALVGWNQNQVGVDPGHIAQWGNGVDALILLAAGSLEPPALRKGHAAVIQLTLDMDAGRRARLERLGFGAADAERLSSLHTRNFM